MLKLFNIFLVFLRELIFNNKDEYDISSSKFNSKKSAVFIIVTILALLSFFLLNRVYNLATEQVAIIRELEQCKTKPKAYEKIQ